MQTFTLRDNYRSDARIVHTASAVIARNTDWQRAALRPLLPEGHPIQVAWLLRLLVGACISPTQNEPILTLCDFCCWSRCASCGTPEQKPH